MRTSSFDKMLSSEAVGAGIKGTTNYDDVLNLVDSSCKESQMMMPNYC